MESLKVVASTLRLPCPLPADNYPVYGKACFRIPDGTLAKEVNRGWAERGPDAEDVAAAAESAEAFLAIQVQR